MSTETAEKSEPQKLDKSDPENYRMSIGEHLEELRTRLVYAILGFVVAGAVCLYFSDRVIWIFCRPLMKALESNGVNAAIYTAQVGEGFLVWMRIGLICGAALAGPWIIWQLWLFVAAGLYPHERKWITKYVPFSIVLLISGMVFVYFLVLPLTLQFFIGFNLSIKPPNPTIVATTQPIFTVPEYNGDPVPLDAAGKTGATPPNALWYNSAEHKLKAFIGGKVQVIQFLPEGLVAPHIILNDYIDLVTLMLLAFGLAFQLPLVVMAIVRIGVVDIDQLRSARKYVYFALLVLSAAISPGDVITVTLLMLLPLIGLYELGILLSKKAKEESKEEEPTESTPV